MSFPGYRFYLILLAAVLASTSGTKMSLTNTIKMDHFGYRPADTKLAYLTADPGDRVEIRRSLDDSLAYSVDQAGILDRGTDTATPPISGDHVWWVDFSGLKEAGRFYLYAPHLNERSYSFAVAEDIYQAPMAATLQALYLQRCGTPKPKKYAGPWGDGQTCHRQDTTARPACADSPYGTLDLSGGWHDAGDYNKYIGGNNNTCGANWHGDAGQTLWYLLSAYELNPDAFYDGQNNIPESGNGVPDILDEAKWHLDWYLKMQMSDRHVLSVLHQTNYTGGAPPSTDTTTRYYYPPHRNSEAIFVAGLAHAARLFSQFPIYEGYAETLTQAAFATWEAWVRAAPASDYKFWAAAELFRLDGRQTGAQAIVDQYRNWSNFTMNTNQLILNYGIYTYVQAAGATAATIAGMKAAIGRHVDTIFRVNDHYNSGMYSYDYFWSSNQIKAEYGMGLIWGARLGSTGSYSVAECRNHALNYLHYLNGANPLNMVYMSNADLFGAKHGIWHLYHAWFGSYNDTRYSRPQFIGKPSFVDDPLYPYFSGPDNFGIRDDDVSAFGPPPGFVVDGPTYQYHQFGGQARPPNLPDGRPAPYAKAYRDWNYSDPQGSRTMPWIVNETGIYYNTAYALLASQFVDRPPVQNKGPALRRPPISGAAAIWPRRSFARSTGS